MRAFTTILLGALSIGVASAHEYPFCEHDNCYRQLIDERFADQAKTFCPEYLAGDFDKVPELFGNCKKAKKLSSACSCITYQPSTTAEPSSSSTAPPEVSSTTDEPVPSSSASASYSSGPVPSASASASASYSSGPVASSSPSASASYSSGPAPSSSPSASASSSDGTITTTYTKTYTSCPPEVTNCPTKGPIIVTLTTTICPESSTLVSSTVSSAPPPGITSAPSSAGTISAFPSSSTTGSVVTAGADRVVQGSGFIAAAAGLLAAAFL